MIQCLACGAGISRDATSCPHCGDPLQILAQRKNDEDKEKKKLSPMFTWSVIGVMLFVFVPLMATKEENKHKNQPIVRVPEEAPPPVVRNDEVVLGNTTYKVGGFGSNLILHTEVINKSDKNLKDIEIRCVVYGKSGTVIDGKTSIVYDAFYAKETKSITDVNMGFVNSQLASVGCQVTDFKIVQ